MVTKFGMSDKLGPINYGSDNNEIFIGRDFAHSKNFSEKVSAEIDDEVRSIINNCYNRCFSMIKENNDKLDAVARVLIEKEKISGEEFEQIFNEGLISKSEETADADSKTDTEE